MQSPANALVPLGDCPTCAHLHPRAACSRERLPNRISGQGPPTVLRRIGLNRSRISAGASQLGGPPTTISQPSVNKGAQTGKTKLGGLLRQPPGWDRGPRAARRDTPPVLRQCHRPKTPFKNRRPAGVCEDTGQALTEKTGPQGIRTLGEWRDKKPTLRAYFTTWQTGPNNPVEPENRPSGRFAFA